MGRVMRVYEPCLTHSPGQADPTSGLCRESPGAVDLLALRDRQMCELSGGQRKPGLSRRALWPKGLRWMLARLNLRRARHPPTEGN